MAPSTPTTGPSSRLLSMKFMQRGAATADSVPSSEEGSSKRRKLTHPSSKTPTPAGADNDLFSQDKIRAAVEELEAKRKAAVERRAAELSDSHWVLDIPVAKEGAAGRNGIKEKPPLRVVYVGYGEIDRAAGDSDYEDTQDDVQTGRRITGDYKRKEEKEADKDSGSDSSDDDSDSDEDGEISDSSDDSRSPNPKKKRKPSKKGARPEKQKKGVKLSRLTSISSGGTAGGISQGGGGTKGASALSRPPMKCFSCNGLGHKSSDCPNKGRKRRAAPY
ncbi:hypothetical protein jhhlp_000281 [Lomentospora prolificans]|uniref:CCHC-type domain-containing protein n=1 Tax=Lomentospora prolificans TaxID=41688 RepID=A0A2N3NKI3_9PEZI|nr:hypothetical protein jhhlp_000281 [Lomentospora prolificans]